MPDLYLHIDDEIMDPDLISANYAVGNNAFFHIERTIGTLIDEKSGTGGNSGNTVLAASVGGYGGGGGGGGGGFGGCPEVGQYIWGGTDTPKSIRVKNLPGLVDKIGIYNPLSRNFNLLVSATLLTDQPLVEITTKNGVKCLVSRSHKIIRNTQDIRGTSIAGLASGAEIVRFDPKTSNIFIDELVTVKPAGTGDVVKISLAAEFIYACGSNRREGTLAHNYKPPPDFELF